MFEGKRNIRKKSIDPEKISRVIRLIEALNRDILPPHGDSAAGGTA